MAKLTATYQGQTFTRTTKAAYTHIVVITHPTTNELVDARWSKSAEAAAKPLPHGWEANRVAVIEVGSDDTAAPAVEQAEVELCASNSNAKVMHYRAVGTQVTLCLKATTSRKANARQLADDKVCTGCTAARQG